MGEGRGAMGDGRGALKDAIGNGGGVLSKVNIRIVFIILLAVVFSLPAWAESPEEILRAADQARGNMEGITWTVRICSKKQNKEDAMTLMVKARGFDVVTETIAPAAQKGNQLLMVSGNMWFYKPGLSKPVPISKRQKLFGHAVYGDIAATNYARDYTPTALPGEVIDNRDCHKFDLAAKNKNNTYDRIVYWVAKDANVGVRAEYYTVSGKKCKTAVMKYENRVVMEGEKHPFISHIEIADALLNSDVTTMQFENPVLGALPDYLFNLNLMRR
jgi:outer membrane lipoprotein-sorting protein